MFSLVPILPKTHLNCAVRPPFNQKVLQWPRAGPPEPIHVPLKGEGELRVFCPSANGCRPLLAVADIGDLFRAFHGYKERD